MEINGAVREVVDLSRNEAIKNDFIVAKLAEGLPPILADRVQLQQVILNLVVDQLFEAFHRSKPCGLGLALSICRSIVEAHGGRLWASANESRGVIFHSTVAPNRVVQHPDGDIPASGELSKALHAYSA